MTHTKKQMLHKLNAKEQDKALFLLYSSKVRSLTEKTFKREYIENKELRGKGWALDHRLSIRQAFDHNVPEYMVSHVCNLEMVPNEYNSKKGARSTITFQELIEQVSNYEDDLL